MLLMFSDLVPLDDKILITVFGKIQSINIRR